MGHRQKGNHCHMVKRDPLGKERNKTKYTKFTVTYIRDEVLTCQLTPDRLISERKENSISNQTSTRVLGSILLLFSDFHLRQVQETSPYVSFS